MKIFAATLGGIIGAAQISTAYLIAHPTRATDVGLTGAGGWYLLWTVPLGALIGVPLGWMLANWPRRRKFWREMRKAFLLALILGFITAPMASGMLGLAPHFTAELWQSLEVLSTGLWMCFAATTQIERYVFP